MTTVNFDNLKKSIKSFDVILCTTNSHYSKLINYVQKLINGRGKYTHIAFCIKGCDLPKKCIFYDKNSDNTFNINENELYLFESTHNTDLEEPNIFGKYFDGVQL